MSTMHLFNKVQFMNISFRSGIVLNKTARQYLTNQEEQ